MIKPTHTQEPKHRLSRKKIVLLMGLLFIHNTILDLFFVSGNGIHFFWSNAFSFKTNFIHLMTVALSTALFICFHGYFSKRKTRQKSDS